MTTAVIDEIPEYATVAAPGQRQIVFEHSLDHVFAVVRAVRTWSLPSGYELAFVRERAALRATQHVPLSALLHSYRLGHRTVWGRLVQLLAGLDNILDASRALTTLTLSYTELISGALAEGYVERLPKASIGKGCVRFRRTADVDLDTLSELVSEAARIGPPA